MDDDPAARPSYAGLLSSHGYEACVISSGRDAVELCRAVAPDSVIAAGEPGGAVLDVVAAFCRVRPMPVVLVSDGHDQAAGAGLPDELVVGHLVRPVHPAQLTAAVSAAVRAFEQVRTLREAVAQLQQAAEERKLVERAKGLLMKYAGLGEETAYNRMRLEATNHNRRLVEVARGLLAAGEVFRQIEEASETGPSHGAARVRVTERSQRNGTGTRPVEGQR